MFNHHLLALECVVLTKSCIHLLDSVGNHGIAEPYIYETTRRLGLGNCIVLQILG